MFAYTDLDKSRITNAVSGTNDFLTSKDCIHEFRQLEGLRRKNIAYDLHLRTLSEYIKTERIPRGLRVNLRPTLFSNDADFCKRWEAIINKCSTDLMLATMEHLQKSIPETRVSADAKEQKIRNSFAGDVVSGGMEKLTEHLDKFRMEVQTRKRQKFQRDAMDYATGSVYRWALSPDQTQPPLPRLF
ncbi:hypothetical protein XELAEV_18029251mg [Xenopus laevis]|uniref:Uncharacterized protein n=1 Tax=Xenopus laevis TaxID=8355 RepID=A0A974CRC5_XENLA|nr:hypothetical protein XELAEV_18029251mg [Xenopus laevis]